MSGRLVAQVNTSLDGYVEEADHNTNWHFVDEEYEKFINDTLRSLDG